MTSSLKLSLTLLLTEMMMVIMVMIVIIAIVIIRFLSNIKAVVKHFGSPFFLALYLQSTCLSFAVRHDHVFCGLVNGVVAGLTFFTYR